MDIVFFFVPLALVAIGYLTPDLTARRAARGAGTAVSNFSQACCADC